MGCDVDSLMNTLKDEDYNSATFDECYGTANTARAARLRARYPWVMETYKYLQAQETCLSGENPSSSPTAANPVLNPEFHGGKDKELHDAIEHLPNENFAPQTSPPVHCPALNCGYNTPMGADDDTALEFLRTHVHMADPHW